MIRPSTPRSINRLISARSLTVHASTLSFRACASSMRALVRLGALADHTAHPAASTSFGTDPPYSANVNPACHGERPLASGLTVSKFESSEVRQAVSISGAIFLAMASVRQSKDCSVVLALMSAARMRSTTSRTNMSGSTVVSPLIGVIFVSMSMRTAVGLTSAMSSSSVG